MDAFNENKHETLGMFKVTDIRGPLATLESLDFDDLKLKNVYAGDVTEPSFAVGETHLINLILKGGLWRITFCSPAYEEVDTGCELCLDPDWEWEEGHDCSRMTGRDTLQ